MRALLPLLLALATPAAGYDIRAVARDALAALQAPSFAREVEHCGLILRRPDGSHVAGPARAGEADGCTPEVPDRFEPEAEVVASYHTHGAFDWEADAEMPSILDLLGDAADGIDGFVSTPGGRFWFVDGDRVEARLICGAGCLPVDPDFVPGVWGPVRDRYDPATLRARDRAFE